MRLSALRRELATLYVLLDRGCGHEHCVIKAGPAKGKEWREEPARLGVCVCTPPAIAMQLRRLAKTIAGYQWEEE